MGVMFAASDAEWLPSTIVQSAAALVAVIGGLLISRLVGLAGERSGVVHRLAELDAEAGVAARRAADLHARLDEQRREDFIRWAANEYDGGEDPGTLLQAMRLDPDAEQIALAEEFLQFLIVARRTVENCRSAGIPWERPDISDPAFDPVWGLVEDEEARRLGQMYASIPFRTPPSDADQIADDSRRAKLRADSESTDRHLEALTAARKVLLDRMSALQPEGVGAALAVLAFVVAAGIVLPVVVMAMRWPDITTPWRLALVSAFLASVTAVGGYIWWMRSTLTTSQPPS